MAVTNYIKEGVEPWVRGWLTREYPGHRFDKLFLALTSGGKHEFDAVSKDHTIVAGIKTHSWKTRGGNLPSGKFAQLYQELYFLSLVEATTKLLILTDGQMYTDFVARSQGKLAPGIEIRRCELPGDIADKLRGVQANASLEQKSKRDEVHSNH